MERIDFLYIESVFSDMFAGRDNFVDEILVFCNAVVCGFRVSDKNIPIDGFFPYPVSEFPLG